MVSDTLLRSYNNVLPVEKNIPQINLMDISIGMILEQLTYLLIYLCTNLFRLPDKHSAHIFLFKYNHHFL